MADVYTVPTAYPNMPPVVSPQSYAPAPLTWDAVAQNARVAAQAPMMGLPTMEQLQAMLAVGALAAPTMAAEAGRYVGGKISDVMQHVRGQPVQGHADGTSNVQPSAAMRVGRQLSAVDQLLGNTLFTNPAMLANQAGAAVNQAGRAVGGAALDAVRGFAGVAPAEPVASVATPYGGVPKAVPAPAPFAGVMPSPVNPASVADTLRAVNLGQAQAAYAANQRAARGTPNPSAPSGMTFADIAAMGRMAQMQQTPVARAQNAVLAAVQNKFQQDRAKAAAMAPGAQRDVFETVMTKSYLDELKAMYPGPVGGLYGAAGMTQGQR